MFKYSMEDVKRVADRSAAEVAAEEAAVRATFRVAVKEDPDLWGQRSMSEVLGFQEANSYCNHVAGWLNHA